MNKMTVFQAFPNAIEKWQIAPIAYSTITGNMISGTWQTIDVIVDEGSSTQPNQAPNFANAYSDLLIYCKPSQLPTVKAPQLMADYAVQDNDGYLYAIDDVGIGKNQETGLVEHIELKLRQIDAEDEQS